jgi:SAM-dependent methyltransferase
MLKPYLSNDTKILEIGCGNGLVMWQFENELNLVIDGCDLNLFAFKNMMNVSGSVFLYDIFDLHPDLIGKYDIVILLDVLEHIDDDSAFLSTSQKYLKEGGLLVVGVPAHQGLFSVYDQKVGHKRRYSRYQLEQLFKSANFIQITSGFWGFSLLPLTFLRKIYLKFLPDEKVVQNGFKPPSNFINRFIEFVMKIETLAFRKVITGTSIIAIGKKQL